MLTSKNGDHVMSFEGCERVIDTKMHRKYILQLQPQITNI